VYQQQALMQQALVSAQAMSAEEHAMCSNASLVL